MHFEGLFDTSLPNLTHVFEIQGWIVKASAPIAAHTLLCEYGGQVDYTRHHLFDSQDDIFELIRSPRSATRFALPYFPTYVLR